ncbi:unnamed protein product [Eruca vesicaria subsp. sativa]|uniref:Uncharacterized protein n=1 Tax=Eruca vesicaria subsp. sativa TaxID=29727 RepID=A0ABC8JQ92_ERUVS|nr:unnamed protein product [Eruca vesicaria subsp. sativa]
MMMISCGSNGIGLQRFLFTPPPQQLTSKDICYWGEELRTSMQVRCKAGTVPLMKQSHKFLSSLSSPAFAGDPSATNRHIKKFVAASPKSVSLNVLSHLLSPHSSHPHLSFFALSKLLKLRGLIGIPSSLLILLLCSINKKDSTNQKLYSLLQL